MKQFKYLGCWLTEDGRNSEEVKTKIGMVKSAFVERKGFLTSRLSLALKKKIVKSDLASSAVWLRGVDIEERRN